ncbi:MAG: STIV orfB116 family protein [Sulfuricella sp.]
MVSQCSLTASRSASANIQPDTGRPPILTGCAFGEFRFDGPIASEEARVRLGHGFVSAVGHEASASFLAALLGVEVPCNRIAVAMQPGDSALVLRLNARLPEGKVLTAGEMKAVNFELGWLQRLA